MSATVKVTSAVAAASTAITAAASYSAALSQSPFRPDLQAPNQSEECRHKEKEVERQRLRRPPEEKFAPRFDGMRFIETLISSHR